VKIVLIIIMNKIFQISALFGFACIGGSSCLSANSISVNFHVGDDPQLQEHRITPGESAGSEEYGVLSDWWNNINVGDGGLHRKSGQIFSPTKLKNHKGKNTGAILNTLGVSSYFVGYVACAETVGEELQLPGNQDDLFNSYLSLGVEDVTALQVSNLGTDFTVGGYTVVIYSDTDEGRKKVNASGPRRSIFKLTPSNGTTIERFTEDDPRASNHDSTFDGTFVLSDGIESGPDYSNVAVFEGLTADSFTIQLISPDSKRGGISGFQIISNATLAAATGKKVGIPEPSATVALTGLVALLSVALTRRSRAVS
jgi:hypothetical protein